MACLYYDKLFHPQKATGASMPWAELNPLLGVAATVLGNVGGGEPGRVCTLYVRLLTILMGTVL